MKNPNKQEMLYKTFLLICKQMKSQKFDKVYQPKTEKIKLTFILKGTKIPDRSELIIK